MLAESLVLPLLLQSELPGDCLEAMLEAWTGAEKEIFDGPARTFQWALQLQGCRGCQDRLRSGFRSGAQSLVSHRNTGAGARVARANTLCLTRGLLASVLKTTTCRRESLRDHAAAQRNPPASQTAFQASKPQTQLDCQSLHDLFFVIARNPRGGSNRKTKSTYRP